MRYSYLPNDPSTIRTLATWIYNEWLQSNPEASIDKTISMFSDRIESNKVPLTLIAFDDQDHPVGSASLTLQDMKSHPELSPWLASVYVSREARGQGVASELCLRIEKEAKRLGHTKIYLFTKDQMSLYSRLGWQTRGTEEYRGMHVTIMEKQIV